jgi:hypothetical protein
MQQPPIGAVKCVAPMHGNQIIPQQHIAESPDMTVGVFGAIGVLP